MDSARRLMSLQDSFKLSRDAYTYNKVGTQNESCDIVNLNTMLYHLQLPYVYYQEYIITRVSNLQSRVETLCTK